MKKQILSVVAMLSLAVSLSAAALANFSGAVKADIPFDFMVGKESMKAGHYQITGLTPSGTLVIHNLETKKSVTFQVTNGKTTAGDSDAKLVFNRYGNQYFLTRIWDGGETSSDLIKSKTEREAAKAKYLAQNNDQPEVVTIVAQIGN